MRMQWITCPVIRISQSRLTTQTSTTITNDPLGSLALVSPRIQNWIYMIEFMIFLCSHYSFGGSTFWVVYSKLDCTQVMLILCHRCNLGYFWRCWLHYIFSTFNIVGSVELMIYFWSSSLLRLSNLECQFLSDSYTPTLERWRVSKSPELKHIFRRCAGIYILRDVTILSPIVLVVTRYQSYYMLENS